MREGEGESLRVLSSLGDNYNVRNRQRRALCIYLAEQNKAAVTLRKGGRESRYKKKKSTRHLSFRYFTQTFYFKIFQHSIIISSFQ